MGDKPLCRGELNRRDFLKTAAGVGVALALPGCPSVFDDAGMTAATAILRGRYDDSLADVIEAGFDLVPPPDVNGKRVLLKPNLVDLPREGRPVVTNPAVVIAAAEAFRRRGAAKVIVADGPSLQRDAWQIVDAIGLTSLLAEHSLEFVDLNLADVAALSNAGGYLGLSTLHLPKPVLAADVFVSVPKMKVHHWAGVTLSMKNLVGTMPGAVYGWPRNIIHLRDLNNAVIDLNLTHPPDYAIVDGIVGLEGDGPIHGTAADVGVIVMGDVPSAVDATAARIMGLRPEAVTYLQRAAGVLGPIGESSIVQRGESIASVLRPFQVLSHQLTLTL
jgi:uncharacterized protein (DUF362 family)